MYHTLYDLTYELRCLQYMLEVGADDEQYDTAFVEAQIAALKGDVTNKADGYAKLVRNMQASADAIKAEKDRLAKSQKSLENAIARLKQAMFEAMEAAGMDKVQTSIGKWSLQNNPASVQIIDWKKLPERFLKPVDPDIDRRAILAEYKASGEIFDGCEIVQTRGIRFR